jgi:membrane-associated protease RseP (regulator of RpoE activity)
MPIVRHFLECGHVVGFSWFGLAVRELAIILGIIDSIKFYGMCSESRLKVFKFHFLFVDEF